MSSALRKGPFTTRYMITKALFAAEEFVSTLINPKVALAGQAQQSGGALAQAYTRFREAYDKQMTTTMYMAGGHLGWAWGLACRHGHAHVRVVALTC